ncbi:MAG: replicative DNA helicase [Patescibacteria group bacterium]|nr:replicative DNA helicase [Patescibacteria group bacterium]MCL5224451.1 replicative DNA helicase [Patescibacteria group bacterium]
MARKGTDQLKLPPQDIEAEKSVLGALMIDKDAIILVADVLVPEDFYNKVHSMIYNAILKLWERREPIDILSVTSELKKSDALTEIGGAAYLTELVNSVPTSSHVAHYAKIVKDKLILRQLISASADITESALSEEDDLDTLLDSIEQRIFSISEGSISRNFVPIREELASAYERIERLHESGGGDKIRGVPTGFAKLDDLLSGLQKSDLIIVGARPSNGKTALVLDIARNAAVKGGQTVGVFSLEMSREQVSDRLIAAEAGVDLWRLRTGRLTDDADFQMIQIALDKLNRSKLFVDDTPSPTIIQLRSMARRLQAQQKELGLLVVDYLQLVQPRRNYDSAVQQVTEISRGLKALARELNVPVLAVSQLSRAVDQREAKVPRLSDLRESGSIEQDADVVILMNSKTQGPDNLSAEGEDVVELHVAKHRNGPVGTVELYFDKQRTSFRDLDTRHDESTATN